jgi:PGAP1-like protein
MPSLPHQAPAPPRKNTHHWHPTDGRALVRLATDGTLAITRLAERVHQSVWSTLGAPGGPQPGQTRGLTGQVYRAVERITQAVGTGAEQLLLTRVEPWLSRHATATAGAKPDSPQRQAFVAALNGVMGDHLAATHNPLALPMTLRYQGQALAQVPQGGRWLITVHGLCMNDVQWSARRGDGPEKTSHGDCLAQALGCLPLDVHYNTGLHISDNGALLATLLERLVAQSPTPVTRIDVVAHSMGGLVTRAACQSAQAQGMGWLSRLHSVVFLGTPHHGAPLERVGHWIDTALAATPWSRPWAALGQLRSAGITDLRWGAVHASDWQGRDRFAGGPTPRTPAPLGPGIAWYTLAATTARQRGPVADQWVGDGLVPLNSALGVHKDPQMQLHFPADHQAIMYSTDHLALLHAPAVTQQLLAWLERP